MTHSRRLVIDASIGMAAGGTDAQNNLSVCCRDVLLIVLDFRHRVTMSHEMLEEWHRHASRFSSTWLRQMISRKRVHWIGEDDEYESLLRQIRKLALLRSDLAPIEKDAHLPAAALRSDKAVLALDEEVRKCLAAVCSNMALLREVVWVNPVRPTEKCADWLKKGAYSDEGRNLGIYIA